MPQPEAITTSIVERAGATILAVGGEVDVCTAAQFRTAVEEIVHRRASTVIVDLSAVTFLASVALKILALTAEKLSATVRFAVVADDPVTIRPLQLTRLDEIFALYPTLQDALVGLGEHLSPGDP